MEVACSFHVYVRFLHELWFPPKVQKHTAKWIVDPELPNRYLAIRMAIPSSNWWTGRSERAFGVEISDGIRSCCDNPQWEQLKNKIYRNGNNCRCAECLLWVNVNGKYQRHIKAFHKYDFSSSLLQAFWKCENINTSNFNEVTNYKEL